jgi:rhamnogalacturonan endolyase
MEIFYSLEQSRDNGRGVSLVDARTGRNIWGIGRPTTHVGEGMVADVDASIPGLECFAQESPKADPGGKGYSQKPPLYMLSAAGKSLEPVADFPGFNNWVFWDADLLREYAVATRSPAQLIVTKYTGTKLTPGIKGNFYYAADITGDWREEIITLLPGEMRIYTTTIPAKDRRVCLMQDPVYRSEVVVQTMGYQQPPVTSYYLGE